MTEDPVDAYVESLLANRPPMDAARRERLSRLLNGRPALYPEPERELEFREEQAQRRRRAAAARRLPPLADDRRDPLDRAC
jgi:hypothetical protein